MAPDAVKREFLAEYPDGMGSTFYVILARSQAEITSRYPLFRVLGVEEWATQKPELLERLRMYPAPDGPGDAAVANRSADERRDFLRRRAEHREAVAHMRGSAGTSGTVLELQTWTDIDEDASFRIQMHELWKSDVRYRALPPERQLF